MHIEFCLKLLYSIMCGKNFYIHGSQIPRKCIDLRHFCLFPTQSLPSSFCHQALGSRKLLVTQAAFFRESVSFISRKGWRKLICLIRISSENMKLTWNIIFFIYCMICNFFKSNVMALQFSK